MSSDSAPPTDRNDEPCAAELSRSVRDLVACAALPALWAGVDAAHVASGVVDVLASMLRLDFAGIRVLGANGVATIEAWHPTTGYGPASQSLDTAMGALGEADIATAALKDFGARDPGLVRIVRAPLSVASTSGVVVAGSTRPDFPSPHDALLLRVAVNQGALALESARLVADLQDRDRLKDRLVAEAEAARLEAEAANRAKDEFLAILSHELRTPLTAMLGWVRLLRTMEMTPERTSHALEAVERSTRQQAQLINDLLDVSRIVAGKLELDRQPVELDGIVRAAVEALAGAAAAKGVRVDVAADAGVIVLGEPFRLQQVVANLVSNAVKFVDEAGHVWVEMSADPTSGRACIVVRDDGAGIDAAALPHVFERFRQEDSTAGRRHGGLGLGLAIVQHLVSLHGGTVAAASEGKGRGATFTVELPVFVRQPSPAVAPHAPVGRATTPLQGIRVLVVDDHADSRDLFQTILVWAGAEARTAASVTEALRTLRGAPFDVMLTDLSMPGRDGFDLLDHVRGQLPVIAVTAIAGPETRARVLVAGFAGHITKPVDATALVDAVGRLVGGSRRPA